MSVKIKFNPAIVTILNVCVYCANETVVGDFIKLMEVRCGALEEGTDYTLESIRYCYSGDEALEAFEEVTDEF